MLSRSIVLGVLAVAVVGTPAWAQGSQRYTLYFGGQGGLMSVKSGDAAGKRDLMATAGAHILVTGARSGLLFSVDQTFGTNKSATVNSVVVDTSGNSTSTNVAVTYTGVRRYTLAVLLFPVQHSIVQPYIGIGGGIQHSTGNSVGGHVVATLGTQGFLTAIGGLEFRVAGLSAFGQAQITSAPSARTIQSTLINGSTEYDTGSLFQEPSYSFMAGIRLSLGSARSSGGPASY
jgi:hypothetical protein